MPVVMQVSQANQRSVSYQVMGDSNAALLAGPPIVVAPGKALVELAAGALGTAQLTVNATNAATNETMQCMLTINVVAGLSHGAAPAIPSSAASAQDTGSTPSRRTGQTQTLSSGSSVLFIGTEQSRGRIWAAAGHLVRHESLLVRPAARRGRRLKGRCNLVLRVPPPAQSPFKAWSSRAPSSLIQAAICSAVTR